MFLPVSTFIFSVWCFSFILRAFLFDCSFLFKTNVLIKLIRSSASVGEGLWIDRYPFGCRGRAAAELLGSPTKDIVHKAFSLIKVSVTCLAADILCLECSYSKCGCRWEVQEAIQTV